VSDTLRSVSPCVAELLGAASAVQRTTGVSRLVPHAPRLVRSEDGFAVGKGVAHTLADRVRLFARDREDVREAAVRLVCVIGAPRVGGTQYVAGCFILESRKEAGLRGRWKGIFEADTREEANRKADEWWSKAKGVRFIHRFPNSGGLPLESKQWVIATHYKEEVSPS
jgi:hypothetical protein